MDDSRKLVGYKRSFLNEPYQTSVNSAISYSVAVHRSYNSKVVGEIIYDNARIEFIMSDCSRNISLDFGIEDKASMRNSLYKLDVIIDICESMKKDLKAARLIVREGQKIRKELEEKK